MWRDCLITLQVRCGATVVVKRRMAVSFVFGDNMGIIVFDNVA